MAEKYLSSTTFTCNLPGDIMLEILSRLPLKSLLRFKCVNKSWYSLVHNQMFINMHYNYWYKLQDWGELVLGHDRSESEIGIIDHQVDHQQEPIVWEPMGICEQECLKVVGLSNGLICLTPINYFRYGVEFIVINPALRESKITFRKRVCMSKLQFSNDNLSLGFGFDKKDDDFKIVRVERLKENSEVRINIYSLYGDYWRQIKCSLNFTTSVKGVLLGNSMYWSYSDGKGITVFNLSSERFCTIPLPGGSKESRCWRIMPWEQESIAVIMYAHEINNYRLWITSPVENPEGPCCIWKRDSVVLVDQMYEERLKRKITFGKRFPDYKNVIPIWRYKESLAPVRRDDRSSLNVLHRLQDAFWINCIDDVLEDQKVNYKK